MCLVSRTKFVFEYITINISINANLATMGIYKTFNLVIFLLYEAMSRGLLSFSSVGRKAEYGLTIYFGLYHCSQLPKKSFPKSTCTIANQWHNILNSWIFLCLHFLIFNCVISSILILNKSLSSVLRNAWYDPLICTCSWETTTKTHIQYYHWWLEIPMGISIYAS